MTIHQIRDHGKSNVGPLGGVGTIDPGEPRVTVYASQYRPETGRMRPWGEIERRVAQPLIVPGLASGDADARKIAKARLEYIGLHTRQPGATRRRVVDIECVWGAWLDWDHSPRDVVLAEAAALGCRVVLYPSPSHFRERADDHKWKARGIVMYSQPVSAAEHEHLYRRWILGRCPSADSAMASGQIGCYAPAVDPAHAADWWSIEIGGER